MGLLGTGFDDPQAQAIMALAGGLLRRDAGGGLLGANQAFLAAKQAQQQQAMQQMQMRQYQMQLDREQRAMQTEDQLRKAATDSYGMPAQGGFGIGADGAQMATPRPKFDMRQYVDRVMQIDPVKGIGLQQAMAKETPFKKLDPKDYTPESVRAFMQSGGKDHSLLQPRSKMEVSSGVVYDPYKVQPGTVLPNPNQPFMLGANGQIVPNTAYQQYEITKAGAGKPSVEVKVDNKMGESLAGQVGGMAKDSKIQTSGAVSMFDAADRIEKALNSNKVIAGPGATKVQTVRQIAQVLGGGNDEGIRQTRQVIKSLAQMSVEARKQLQGQGQVTESEAAAVAKADAGDINDLTVGELRDLVTLTKRAAHFTAKSHKSLLDQMAQTEGTKGLVPYYQVQRMDDLLKHTPTLPQIGGNADAVERALKKYGGK